MAQYKLISWSIAYDEFSGLFVMSNLIALVTSLYLFVRGQIKGLGSKQGFIHDFVMGQELVRFSLLSFGV